MKRHLGNYTARAYSLLEVVLASAICASALVPAMGYLRDGMALANKIDTKHLMLICGVSKMEEQVALVAATWATGTIGGDFGTDGFANVRYIVTRADSAASGGITNRLMNVSVTTYSDDNGNDVLDTSESRLVLTTKISKLLTYEAKAGT